MKNLSEIKQVTQRDLTNIFQSITHPTNSRKGAEEEKGERKGWQEWEHGEKAGRKSGD